MKPAAQQSYSLLKILYLIAIRNSKSVTVQKDTLIVENCITSAAQLSHFEKSFGEPTNVISFAFIATFKANIQFLAQAAIPDSLLGLIHLKAGVTQQSCVNWCEPFQCHFKLLDSESSDKGTLYQVQCAILQFGNVCVTMTNTFLAKKRKSNKTTVNKMFSQLPEVLKSITNYRVTLSTARSYAKLSRDYNPIHLSNYLAKLFGQKAAIMHGMYQVHRCIKAIQQENSEILTNVDVEFSKPCYLPSHLEFVESDNGEYYLVSNNKELLHMKLTTKKEA